MSIFAPILAAALLWQGSSAPPAPEYTGPKKRVAVSGFDLAQLGHQLVIFIITDDRRIQHMVAVIVKIDLGFQLFVARAPG